MFFLTLAVVGLAGLGLMAIPGLNRHARAGMGHSGHGGLGMRGAHHSAAAGGVRSSNQPFSLFSLIPSPRIIFSFVALYGACGYTLSEAVHINDHLAAVLAIIPAVLVERFVLTPLWNLLFRFQGTPAHPLTQLVYQEATAATKFSNQKGMVSVTHNGRLVQFRAELSQADSAKPVNVGDRLIIEEVDPARERVTVSLVSMDNLLPGA